MDNKLCNTCHTEKPLADFWKCSANGKQYYLHKCSPCQKSPEFIQKARERSIERTKLLGEVLRAAKNVPCMDCKIKYPQYAMDFDHRPGTEKQFTIGNAKASKKCMWRIHEEITKCDVVCANCHRMRTHERRQAIKERTRGGFQGHQ